MSAPILFLRLEGPLQSWGDDAQWTVRRTRAEPSKSGVLGLIAAASGWGLDAEGDARVAELGRSLRMGVRVDQPGSLLRDYHTVTGLFRQADGKYRQKTELSERYYVSDARFLVALTGPPALLDVAEKALLSPEWPLFLGRKSCPPSAPPLPALHGQPTRGEAEGLEAALGTHPWLPRSGWEPDEEAAPPSMRAVIELERRTNVPQHRALQVRRDVPLAFSRRLFRQRFVYETEIFRP